MKTNWFARLPPSRFDQSEKLWAILLTAGALYVALFAYVPGFEKFGWPCLWKTCTGIECAGCGFTRACAAILTAQWRRAWELNPLVFLVLPYLGWRLLNILTGLCTGKSLNTVIPWRVRRAGFWISTTLAVFYALVRISQQVVS
jgi:hypothetical protein